MEIFTIKRQNHDPFHHSLGAIAIKAKKKKKMKHNFSLLVLVHLLRSMRNPGAGGWVATSIIIRVNNKLGEGQVRFPSLVYTRPSCNDVYFYSLLLFLTCACFMQQAISYIHFTAFFKYTTTTDEFSKRRRKRIQE